MFLTIDSLPIPQLLEVHGQLLATEGKPQTDFLTSNIARHQQSKRLHNIVAAKKYYKVEHEILGKKRQYIDRYGVKRDDVNLACTKLPHPFFRTLVNQKVNYLLSRPFTVNTENENFQKILSDFFTVEMLRKVQVLTKEACQTGCSWLQAFYNKAGNLSYKRIPAEEIIPFWADADKTELDAVIRAYKMEEYSVDGAVKEVMKVEYYTQEGVWYYIETERGLEADPDKPVGKNGHFKIIASKVDELGNPIVDDEGNVVTETKDMNWQYIPFIPFKYNSDEVGLLTLIKQQVNNYDEITSACSDTILDIPNAIKVVKNYDGTDKGEFTANLATYRTAFVTADGNVESLETPLDFTAQEAHLTRLRKDIYEAGSGVDTQEIAVGNVSGVALKFRYADLDMDCNGLILEFTRAIEQVIWFLKVDLINKGKGDYTKEKVEIKFNKAVIINEKEMIDCAANSVGIISDETIIANHPWTTNAQKEKEMKDNEEAEKVEVLEKLQQDTTILKTPIRQTTDKMTKAQRISRQKTKSQKDPDRGKTKSLQ